MASNRELRERADGLAKELGVTVKTEALSNAELVELVGKLEAQQDAATAPAPEAVKPAAGSPPPAPLPAGATEHRNVPGPLPREAVKPASGPIDGATGEVRKPEDPRKRKHPTAPYYVAPRRSVVCAKGHLPELSPIQARDLSPDDPNGAGQKALDDMVRAGAVIKSGG